MFPSMIIGLTGGISTGKSTVSMYLKESFPVIDLDVLARKVLEPGKPAYEDIIRFFGTSILQEDRIGCPVDRQKLGNLIFTNQKLRSQLNSITHPRIKNLLVWEILKCWLKGNRLIFIDAPLLFESKLDYWMSSIIVVYCSPQEQLKRLKLRNNFDDTEAKDRIQSQMPLDQKCRRATFVINNNGTIQDTLRQVNNVLDQLKWKYVTFALIRMSGLGLVALILIKFINS